MRGLERHRAVAAAPPALGIAQWARVVSAFDEWFGRTFAKAWSARNGVALVV